MHSPARSAVGCLNIGCLKWMFWVISLVLPVAAMRADESPSPEDREFFEAKIRPVLVKHCYECHSEKSTEVKGGLRVDTRKGLLDGGDAGPAVIPGDVDGSLLIQAVRYGEDSYQMPPAGKLPDDTIQHLEEWIRRGAPDPRTEMPAAETKASASHPPRDQHWAFQPPRLPARPAVRHADWVRGELDSYLLARLEAAGVGPSPEADRPVLIRRLSFDLVGLPPTSEEITQFVADPAPDAYERLVERLLSRPQFGERWGRHWLDVARYADTKGYVFQEDRSYPEAYTYRDWVIQTLNRDLPYDQFLSYQLAGDRLPPLDSLTVNWQSALGYLTLGRRFLNNRHDIIDDRIDVVMRGMQGLTVTCARCHDHKYDPVSMADYYGLYGVFASSKEPQDAPSALRLVDADNPHDSPILLRGNPGNPGPVVPRGFVKIVAGPSAAPITQGSGRLELAQAIASAQNPLTARVLVNRVWMHLFGRGLVTTPSDFGLRSDPPTQPEVLDVLAVRFMEHGWSLKQLIREIVNSGAYRQASRQRAEAAALDPENRLFWRQNRRRLDLEATRDAVLAASGDLQLVLGGPSVRIFEPPYPPRRSVYAYIDRQNLPGTFRTFDFASPDTHAPQRLETTTPQQSLFLLNHPFVMQQCERLAAQMVTQDTGDDEAGIHGLYRRVFGREPNRDEVAAGASYLDDARRQDESPVAASHHLDAWSRYAQVLLLTNEFQFVD